MAQFRVTCTRKEPVGQAATETHVAAVGTGSWPREYDQLWSVEEVLRAMEQGHQFYTQGEHSGLLARVERFVCPNCGRTSIRSTPEAISDNDLDRLPGCV